MSISAPASFTVNVGTTVPVTNVTVSYGDGQSRQLGTFSGTQTVSHFYSTSGIFDVTVSATDPDGIVTTATTQIAITNLTGTMTSSAATAQRGVTVITFTASVLPSGASIDHYVWEFDDGTGSVTSFGNTQTHVFSSGTPAGIKTVQVTVFPLYGASFKITLQITVTV
ncbi:MAG: PKD domain-containing protein [Acidobacteria bacterium]|nr:MAG: PKD domain-containing protein [Acidobacteriota bacterium]